MIRIVEKEDGIYKTLSNHIKPKKALNSAKDKAKENKVIKILFEREIYSIEGFEAYLLRSEHLM